MTPVSVAALDALDRVARHLATATPDTAAPVARAVLLELRGQDAITVEVGRASLVQRIEALGQPDAEAAVDKLFRRHGLVARDDRVAARRWWEALV